MTDLALNSQVHELDGEIVDLWTQYAGTGEYEGEIFLPTEPNLQRMEDRLESLLQRIRDVEPTNALERITLVHIANTADVLSFRVADDRAFPFRYLANLAGSINPLLTMDERSPEVRGTVLADRLSRAENLLAVVNSQCPEMDQSARDMVREHLDSLEGILAGLPERTELLADSVRELPRIITRARTAVEEARQHYDDLLPPTHPREPLPYEERLRRVWGIKLEELLEWHEEEIDSCVDTFRRIAAGIDPNRDPHEILETDLPSCDRPEDMFPLMEDFVARAREASLSYISLPPGEACAVHPVPEQLKDSYPWGGYSGPDPLQESLRGAVFLNDHNYRAVTLGWMEMMAIHECYPGHHAQRVKTAASDLPKSFKLSHLMNRSGPLNEGIAHRSEPLLQHIFPERAFPLFVAYRRLHTAVRIRADLLLHHYGRPVEEAMHLYEKYMEFSPQAARGQVHFQDLWPGYMTIYYYGQKYLDEMQGRLGWDDPTFTETIFSIGYSGLEVLEEVAKMPPAERRAIVEM